VTEVFADSFYWIALLNPNDAFHYAAVHTPVAGRIVTSLAVQLEVMDAFSAHTSSRASAAYFWERTTRASEIEVVLLDVGLLDRAVTLFMARPDKMWSFTDCISFEIMRQRSIQLALSGDHHFRQAGFQTVFG